MAGESSKATIIEIIRKMVRLGEPEEKIISTLKDLGVREEQAKKLLLLGEADTFALIESELGKLVQKNIEEKKEEIRQSLEREARKAQESVKKSSMDEVRKGLEEFERRVALDLEGFKKETVKQNKRLYAETEERLVEFNQIIERVKKKELEIGKHLQQVSIDMSEARLRGVGIRNRFISLSLIGTGLAFLIVTMYFLVTTFSGEVTVDRMIVTVVMAFIGITMMFVATIV